MTQSAPQPKPHASMLEEFTAELQPNAGDIAAGAAGAASGSSASDVVARNLETILRIPVSVRIVLGAATMPVANLVKLGRGAIIPLDRRVGEPVDVVVNGRLIARGEVVVMDEATSRFGISLTELVGPLGAEKSA